MRNNFLGFFKIGIRFKKEFRRQIRSFIIITLAFTVAFSWRQTTFDLSQSFISWLTNIKNTNISTLLTSTFITIASIFLIYLTSYFLRDAPEDFF